MPESAAYDNQSGQIYVSNVNGYALDGNGFVSRVSDDGMDIRLKWLTGLNSPTGMAIKDGKLYIADFDSLVIADIASQSIIARIPSPDPKPSMNDVAISPDGQVFISGSSSRSIYTLNNEHLIVWKHDKNQLEKANGLLVDNSRLIHGGLSWSVFDLNSKQLSADFKAPSLEIQEIDGITAYGCGIYLVTLIDDARLWQVDSQGNSQVVSELPINAIDIQYHAGRLYAPIVGGGLSVFDLPEIACPKE